jgi:hypothetical protein
LSRADADSKIEIVSGNEIVKWYDSSNYQSTIGKLGSSCMSHEECSGYFDIYTKNPEVVSLLILKNKNGKLVARALLWKTDIGEYFMDRVYTCNDSDVLKFTNYAKQNGWLYKYKMASDEQTGLVFKYNGKNIFGRIVVKLSRLHFNKYPFVDTLTYANGDDMISNVGFVVNEDDDDSDEGFIMGDTGGDKDTCSECNGTGYDSDNSGECRKCDGDGEVNCPNCKGSGDIYCSECDSTGEQICRDCEGNGDVDCPSCGGMGSNECTECDRNGSVKCKECNGTGNGEECTKCNGDGEFICKQCKGEDVICITCEGQGTYSRKWGRGTRTVTCSDCGGEGKGKSGTTKERGCICSECVSISSYGYSAGNWYNKGTIDCKKCDGEGTMECKSCEGQGDLICKKCDGDGEIKCEECSYGTIRCKKCDGDGNIGKCKKCKGEGNLGECKSCDDGRIKCVTCNGTGERDKNVKSLCPECAGILDELKSEIRSNIIKIV